jgi:hypothetical protein
MGRALHDGSAGEGYGGPLTGKPFDRHPERSEGSGGREGTGFVGHRTSELSPVQILRCAPDDNACRYASTDARRPTGLALTFIACTLLALALAAPALADIQISSSLVPDSIGVDEVVTFSIEAHGGGFDNLSFEPTLRLENLELAAGPMTAENISFVNGSLSRSYRISWELRARAPGRARVRASIRLNGQVRELPAKEVAVQRAGANPAAPDASGGGAGGSAGNSGADEDSQDPFSRFFGGDSPFRRFFEPPRRRAAASPRVFVREEAEPAAPYVGQQVLWTLYLYTREEVNAIDQESVPTFHGFWVHDIPQPQSLPHDMVDIDGERYARVPLMRKALFALHSGPITVDPVDVELVVRPIETGFWGSTLDPPEPVRLRAPAVAISPRPLPPPPPGFAGTVGHLALRASLAPRDLRLGEAATLTLTLAGDGRLSSVPAPEVRLPPGLKLLPPQQQGQDAVAGTTVRGERTWSFAVIPERAGSYRVKVPPLPYFDPQTGAYRTADAPAFDLTARPAPVAVALAEPAPPPHGPKDAGAPPLLSLAWLRARLARPRDLLWLLALPGIAALAALARRRNGGVGASGAPAGARGRAEAHLAAAAAEERPRQAAVEIEAAVGEILAERWGVPAGAPARRWPELAAAGGATAETAATLDRLAEDLHYLRHAPQLSTTETLKSEALQSCRGLLRRAP